MTSRVWSSPGELTGDVSFAVRQMRKSAGFTMVAAVTLALGVGANTAVFSLADATLLKPLPFPEPERLVLIAETTAKGARGGVSHANLHDWEERGAAFERIAGYTPGVGGMVIDGADGLSETISRQWVTSGFFDVLGVRPVAGRMFLPEDDRERRNVVVLAEGFWRRRFGGDPSLVGRDVRFDGLPFTVVGIAPREFRWIEDADMWAMRPLDDRPQMRGARFYRAIGRLAPGTSIEVAQDELKRIAGALATEFPATNANRSVAVEPLRDALLGGDTNATAWLLATVVGFVLLICCANVSNLVLARSTARTGEIALRSALGAGRARIVRQLVTETLLLATGGGVLGLGIGAAIVRAAPAVLPEGLLPAAVVPALDLRLVLFSLAATVFAGLAAGLAPAWHVTGTSPARLMVADSRTSTSNRSRLRSGLVLAEVTAATVLLVGAGLLLRSLLAIACVDPGYRAEGVLSMLVDPIGSRYPSREALQRFYDDIEAQIGAVPGVRSVAWTSALPMSGGDGEGPTVEILGDAPVDPGNRPNVDYQIVNESYFSSLDIGFVRGRAFDSRDRSDVTPVSIVNEAFARRHLGGRDPVGVRIALRPPGVPGAAPTIREIVGVARQVKKRADEREDTAQVYVPMKQHLIDDMYVLVTAASGEVADLARPVRAAIGRVDREQLVSVRDIETLDRVAERGSGGYRFRASIVGAFAALALLLAMVGVYGILAYGVQQRRRELAVRRALGATTPDVMRLVAWSATRLIGAGTLAGVTIAAASGRALSGLLFGVEPTDLSTVALVCVALCVAAAAAIAGPAWRAARLDPAATLRS